MSRRWQRHRSSAVAAVVAGIPAVAAEAPDAEMTGAVVAGVAEIAVARAAELHLGGTLRRALQIPQAGLDVSAPALYSFALDSFRKP